MVRDNYDPEYCFDYDDYDEVDDSNYDDGCPMCGGDNIIKEGRCTTCLDCGWSKCSI